LSITLQEKALTEYRTPEELINVIATCPLLLTSKVEFDECRILAERRIKELRPNLKTLQNYIMNIPSDYYRVLHPKYKPLKE